MEHAERQTHQGVYMTRYDNGAYSRIQFLTAVRHSMGAHTETLCPAADSSSGSDEGEASSATTTAADVLMK